MYTCQGLCQRIAAMHVCAAQALLQHTVSTQFTAQHGRHQILYRDIWCTSAQKALGYT